MAEKTVIKYTAGFGKKGDMVYISHLDLMRLFRRAIRRADLAFVLTGGFTRRVRISMPKALKLGVGSDSEEMAFWLTEEMAPEKLKGLINCQLPEGIKLTDIKKDGGA